MLNAEDAEGGLAFSLRKRVMRAVYGKPIALNTGDQVTRLIISPPGCPEERRIALALGGRVDVYLAGDVTKRAGLPIRFRGGIGFASFTRCGTRLLTWSGPTWGAFNTVRRWSLEPPPSIDWKDGEIGKDAIAPEWLPDFAEAITGQGGGSDEDGDLYPERRTIEDFLEKWKLPLSAPPFDRLVARFGFTISPAVGAEAGERAPTEASFTVKAP